ncbi:hypothetical protein [Campylobacter cuniculorum]|uniref:Yip1 domain-containing protein n=2 Tax=Campylobacter cuniculorum TaxID=374106 RepID=A0A1W6BWZ7_9BACT|nr:hypothetical protein [Campylobacter cuniculorum]ARJ56605.1 hypothetical protein CCUN_1000 [Campylobacter cuniculorum DSM 23162 = LMG 24588]QOR04082.1 hypothetical protein A0071_07935 [Campylobacter cuniculorum]
MQIPIYSKLKAKLESKGIDNISSGQIAWFVCSLVLALVTFLIVYFTGIVEDKNLFLAIFELFRWQLFIFIIYFCIPFNLLYIYNAIPLVLSGIMMFLTIITVKYFSIYFIICCGVSILLLLAFFKRKFIFSVLLFAMGYTCTLFLLIVLFRS